MLPSPVTADPIYLPTPPASLRAWVDVDLDAVRHNAAVLHARAGVPLFAMVKADAYGVGMLPVVRALGLPFRGDVAGSLSAATPWGVGVATLDEAATLRQAGCTARVLCTTPLAMRELADALALDIRPALHRPEDIVAWSALGGTAWHLAIDTGMSRAGVRWDSVANLDLILRAHPPEGVFTHFHSAELDNGSRAEQESRFAAARETLQHALPSQLLVHSDNSAGIASRDAARGEHSPGHLARPGIGLYGSTVADALGLRPVVHLRGRMVDVRDVLAGESVSYGASWHASATRRIATVAIGYADGYRRALSNRGVALIRGQRAPVVGTVTMDMVMLDVTDIATGCSIGDIVTLIGRDGNECLTVDEVAAAGGLSPYELLVGMRLRAPRRYFESPPTAANGVVA